MTAIFNDENYQSRDSFFIDQTLLRFIEQELIPVTLLDKELFYQALRILVEHFASENRRLLETRASYQRKIDDWHRNIRGKDYDASALEAFLREINYVVTEPEEFQVSTDHVDAELSTIAGPQLVVPVINARFALNAANARWGSLYDALYGSDALVPLGDNVSEHYDPARGRRVIAFAKTLLDEFFPLEHGSHQQAEKYWIEDHHLKIQLSSAVQTGLKSAGQLCGYRGKPEAPDAVLLQHQGLHLELVVDRAHSVGAEDGAGIKDIVLESAITTIMDFEDSVAAVDGEDKTEVYRNLLGLVQGNLSTEFIKNGKRYHRSLNPDRCYTGIDGKTVSLSGRSLLLVRNVGLHMTTPAVMDAKGNEIYEGILDTLITAVIGLVDLGKSDDAPFRNSRTGSIYIVKPKLQGPEEVALCCAMFAKTEELLKLPVNTLKMGIMDEEHRTSLNLKACIYEARERIIFINTGFLDRTGSEIHTHMEAGPMIEKTAMKNQPWLQCYEDWNVDAGLQTGLFRQGQIGKGMWPMPAAMGQMLATKITHPRAGASCAWVPSPTAATLHAIHYFRVLVDQVQQQLIGRETLFNAFFKLPLSDKSRPLTEAAILQELENNAQGILGYVVRWVDQGVGCSKVPDIHNIDLMEDRATLRISSQHIANWLHHGICTQAMVREVFIKMAQLVDEQNIETEGYQPMSDNLEQSLAFQAALRLVFEGRQQPSGYTEPLLHQFRKQVKLIESMY